MNKKILLGIAVVAVGVGFFSAFNWEQYIGARNNEIRAGNTPTFQWDMSEDGAKLVLFVAPNLQSARMDQAPPVPVASKKVSILGLSGTVAPKALVQVINKRTEEQKSVIANERGAFEILVNADEGDVFSIFSMPIPAIISAPISSYAGQSVVGQIQ